MSGPESFPRQYARTRRFTCGEPKSYRPNTDGTRVVFLRSLGGDDPMNRLWCIDRRNEGGWSERLVVDPLQLDMRADGSLPAAELARRERLREQASGITSYDVDAACSVAVFALNGTLVVADLDAGTTHTLATKPGGYDPRLSPDGQHVAYVSDSFLRVVSARRGSTDDRLLVGEDNDAVSWGVVDFVAAEELHRFRGFWWSPDSTHVLAQRVDVTNVNVWTIADPTNPERPAVTHRYPAAGTPNAQLALAIVDIENATRQDISWSHDEFPYLVDAQWTKHGLTLTLLDRSQRHVRIVDVTPESGRLRTLHDLRDDTWVELAHGVPIRLADDNLLLTVDGHVPTATPAGLSTPEELDTFDDPEGTRALVRLRPDHAGYLYLSPANLQIRSIVAVEGNGVIAVANASRPIDGLAIPADPATLAVLRISIDGTKPIEVIAGDITDPGIHDATVGGGVSILRSTSIDRMRTDHLLLDGGNRVAIGNTAEVAAVAPRPQFFRAGDRAIPCCVFFPTDVGLLGGGFDKLPVVMDPYGGPHASRVVASRNAHASSQWLADQGFIVVVADGRGHAGHRAGVGAGDRR